MEARKPTVRSSPDSTQAKGVGRGRGRVQSIKCLKIYEEESRRMPSRSGVARVVGGLIQQAPIGPESGVRGAITPNKGKNKKQTLIH